MMMVRRIGTRIKTSFSGDYLHRRRFFPFSSSSPDTNPKTHFDGDKEEGVSDVYKHALKFQRPNIVRFKHLLLNSASFIGSVDRPVQIMGSETTGCIRAYTVLRVKSAGRNQNRTFGVLLHLKDDIAKLCIEHLKPNDVVHVSGSLGCYRKDDQSGGHAKLHYKVFVKEVNRIMQSEQGSRIHIANGSQSEEFAKSGLDKYKDSLQLWQIFFANPHEWWDNRKSKTNPQQPDFKHKDTGEALWLHPNNPPWIKRQLQVIESELVDKSRTEEHSASRWVCDL